MLRTMSSRILLTGVLLMAVLGGVCLAETVNINPFKIVLNAQGAADDIQANVVIGLPSAAIVDYNVALYLDGTVVAQAESAFYCWTDSMLIIGFDRTSLQDNQDVQDMANTTVQADVVGYVTVRKADGEEVTRYFSGSDTVEIVAPGKNGQ